MCSSGLLCWILKKNSLRATLTYFFPAVLFLLTSSQPCLCGCQKKRIVHHRNVYKIYLLVCSTRKCCASPIFRMRKSKKQLNFKVNVHISWKDQPDLLELNPFTYCLIHFFSFPFDVASKFNPWLVFRRWTKKNVSTQNQSCTLFGSSLFSITF